jgi:short-subunit dehydrogenase
MQNKPYILISGATSDIGTAIAEVLSKDYSLLLHGRSMKKLEGLKEYLKSHNSVKFWMADLSLVNTLNQSLNNLIQAENIQISGFVHCAGNLKILPFKNFNWNYIQDIYNVNLFSAIAILQVLLKKYNLPFLNRLIFISALYSKRGNKGNSIYASSKGAVDSLVKSLALELAPNITVNSILPGVIRTKMSEGIFNNPEILKQLSTKNPLGFGKCEDIALMVQYLLSDGGRWITAQNYYVDGGMSMF